MSTQKPVAPQPKRTDRADLPERQPEVTVPSPKPKGPAPSTLPPEKPDA